MKLVFALYEKYGIPESEKEDYLEPAAIATVGDIMGLQGENRILVKETDNGRRIQEQIDDLKQLKQWYER